MIDTFLQRTTNLINGEYFCHFCKKSCPQCSAENMSADLWHCPTCNVSYEVHCDELLHKIIFKRKIGKTLFHLELDFEENKIKIFECNTQQEPVLPEIKIDAVSHVSPDNVLDKIKTWITFS